MVFPKGLGFFRDEIDLFAIDLDVPENTSFFEEWLWIVRHGETLQFKHVETRGEPNGSLTSGPASSIGRLLFNYP